MRVVLDTNVIVSAALVRGGNEDRILRAWQRAAFELILSPKILEEMGRVLLHQKLQRLRWMVENEVISLLQSLAEESVLVSGRLALRVSRDPEDDKFLAAAIEGNSGYVVTGDKDLLDLKTYRGAQIVSPTTFLRVLREEERRR